MRTQVRSWLKLVGIGSLALALVPIVVPSAAACGGFFCSREPIDQTGEQIVFGVDDDTVTAHIQIFFTGEAEDFAWVVPVASMPEIGVGTQDLFDVLRARTEPRFEVEWNEDNNCYFWGDRGGAEMAAPSAAAEDDGGDVNVLQSRQVGPYDTVVLQSDDASALVTWLNDNNFDQPEESTELIAHYVEQDMLFVALKLQQDQGTGDIQPIVLKFQESQPCVPLVLTRIAAMPDMPVRVWVLGEHRAAPMNWMHVEVNPKKIDWFSWTSNWVDVATQAIDEAAGHGFVTEFAGPHADFTEQLLWYEGRYNLEGVRNAANPVTAMQSIINQGFSANAKLMSILQNNIPMPAELAAQGVDEQNFYNNMQAYEDSVADLEFDAEQLADDLDEFVVTPLREAQQMIESHPYMTRLLSTVSPDEMTRDPLFHFNPDLPDVARVRTAKGEAICDSNGQPIQVTLTFDNGTSLQLDVNDIYNEATVDAVSSEPAAERIELIGATGAPQLVTPDEVEEIDLRLDTQEPQTIVADLASRVRVIESVGKDDGGCAGASAPVSAFALALMLMALLGVRRRRA